MSRSWDSIGAVLVASMCVGLAAPAAAQHGDGGHHGGECDPFIEPILSVADVDADGRVTGRDVAEVTAATRRDYHPLYDLDADGDVDHEDVRQAAHDLRNGRSVPMQDTQVATAALETMRYYGPGGIQLALADGFIPFTTLFHGHGAHFLNFGRVYYDQFDVANVPGLNFDENGQLVAAFYIRTIAKDPNNPLAVDPNDDHPPHHSFHGLEHHAWHYHQSVWISGLGTMTPDFQQELPLEEVLCRVHMIGGPTQFFPVSGHLYSPKFYMLHVWVHKLNECGLFAGTDPTVAVGYPDEHLTEWDPANSWPMCGTTGGGGGHGGH